MVLASRTGTFTTDVRDGVDGMLVEPGSARALREALHRLADRSLVERLRAGVVPPDLDGPWQRYLEALLAEPRGRGA